MLDIDTRKPILGVREWRMKDNKLLPLHYQYCIQRDYSLEWSPGLNKSYCKGIHKAPCPETCHCGLNAWFNAFAINLFRQPGSIIGMIAGAGEVQVHKHGFRSSEAQILGLISPLFEGGDKIHESYWARNKRRREQKKFEALADYYDVPVFTKYQELILHSKQYATEIKFSDLDYKLFED